MWAYSVESAFDSQVFFVAKTNCFPSLCSLNFGINDDVCFFSTPWAAQKKIILSLQSVLLEDEVCTLRKCRGIFVATHFSELQILFFIAKFFAGCNCRSLIFVSARMFLLFPGRNWQCGQARHYIVKFNCVSARHWKLGRRVAERPVFSRH